MKIGDKVRFLSEIGGGKVAGFQGKNIVLVEDEDGFQVPMQMSEVVVIGEENYDTSHVIEMKQQTNNSVEKEVEPADKPITFKAQPEERKGGEALSAYLAFVPIDIKELTNTRFEAYFVNDSNYYMRFTYATAEGNSWKLRVTEEVEPNTKLFLEEFGREDLNDLERVAIQILPYKTTKHYLLKPSVDVQFRIDAVKFYKLHTFQNNAFFEQPALVYTIIKDDKPVRPLVIDAQQLKANMYQKGDNTPQARPEIKKEYKEGDPIVVDLHADALLETTNGMNATDILNYQLDVLRKTLKTYEKKKGTKIIFIHGKGEGVLRKAIINELQYKYKHYIYQDASFREYGYGATQVTIK
ncbi:DUF2027 domain-containing protein [Xylanibacter brevis]|uniref:DUF2027 domain-containing protein n=1 Tax=Xylanibacter brevis TaxID=83231 RepID=UPI000482588D|nr:DUF2027 domain-containing protein [Xylanibacter brevis]